MLLKLIEGASVVVTGFFGSSLGLGISFGASTGAAGAVITGPVLQPVALLQPVSQLLLVQQLFLLKRALIRSSKPSFLAHGSQAGAHSVAHTGAGAQTGAGAHTGAGAAQAGAAHAGEQSLLFLAKRPLRRSQSLTRGPHAGAQAVSQVAAAGVPHPPQSAPAMKAELINNKAVFTGKNLLGELRDASHGASTAPKGDRENRRVFGCPFPIADNEPESDPK